MTLLRKYSSTSRVVTDLMEQYGVSIRQAYRYIQEAEKSENRLPIPEKKIVFTVKIPLSVIQHLRKFAKSTGQSLSDITTQALKVFLSKGD